MLFSVIVSCSGCPLSLSGQLIAKLTLLFSIYALNLLSYRACNSWKQHSSLFPLPCGSPTPVLSMIKLKDYQLLYTYRSFPQTYWLDIQVSGLYLRREQGFMRIKSLYNCYSKDKNYWKYTPFKDFSGSVGCYWHSYCLDNSFF